MLFFDWLALEEGGARVLNSAKLAFPVGIWQFEETYTEGGTVLLAV